MAKLNFDAADTLYATHGLHPFAAKCPPQLAKYGINRYSKRGETVLDPMMGSGTTLVEARLLGRHAVGYDIDPLARLMAGVKSRLVSDSGIETACENVVRRTIADLEALRLGSPTIALKKRATPPDFPRRDFWFEPWVSESLALLSYHIDHVKARGGVRDFLWVAFSSLILSRTSVANARDIVHSRPHYWKHSRPPAITAKFEARISRMRQQAKEFRQMYAGGHRTTISARVGDARKLRLAEESIDLLFTSPPYVTALDYPRAHFLAVAWMEKVLGVDHIEYGLRAPSYIGSERGSFKGDFEIDEAIADLDQVSSVLSDLAETSERHAKLAQRYFLDMYRALEQAWRVLKTSRHAILVVCPSHIRRVRVPTHEVLIEIGRAVGFRLKRRYERTISERRRVLPYLPDEFGHRMSTEYVLIFQKVREVRAA